MTIMLQSIPFDLTQLLEFGTNGLLVMLFVYFDRRNEQRAEKVQAAQRDVVDKLIGVIETVTASTTAATELLGSVTNDATDNNKLVAEHLVTVAGSLSDITQTMVVLANKLDKLEGK